MMAGKLFGDQQTAQGIKKRNHPGFFAEKVVRLAGFEPATSGIGIRHSIP